MVSEAYGSLRMSPEREMMFLKHFEDGMIPSAAKTYDEINLATESHERQLSVVVANEQINPTERQVKHLYTKWR